MTTDKRIKVMIPAGTIVGLLEKLYDNLQGEVDHDAFLQEKDHGWVDEKFAQFFAILRSSEDDCSIVLEMIMQDYECIGDKLVIRLHALMDYIEIALAIYAYGEWKEPIAVFH